MICTHITLPDGTTAVACGPRRRFPKCKCGSGKPADLLCDWKIDGGTCDASICSACSTSPAPGKDLCAEHTKALEAWNTARTLPR